MLLALVGALPLLPAALASPSIAGDLALHGSLHLPSGAEGDYRPRAALAPDAAGLARFSLSAPSATVCVYEYRYAEAAAAGVTARAPHATEGACSARTALRLDLSPEGDHAGWWGLYASPESSLRLGSTLDHGVAPRSATVLATGNTDVHGNDDAGAPDFPAFLQRFEEPHLYLAASGAMTYEGPGRLKIKGPDLRLASGEGAAAHWTGETAASDAPARERVVRWIHVDFPAGSRLDAESATPVKVVARDAPLLSWDGNATLTPTAGLLRAERGAYLPAGRPAWLEGRFTASLAADPGATGALLRLDGELRATSLPFAAAPPPPGGSVPWPWVLVLVVGAAVASGGAVAGLGRLRPRRTPPAPSAGEAWDVEACVEMLDAGMAEEDFGRALAWAERARRLAPTSARLAADEGWCRINLCDLEGALRAYEDAHRLGLPGEDHVGIASAVHSAGAPPEVVEAWLVRAVERAPWVVGMVESDFPWMARRPAWERAAREAIRRAGACDEPDDAQSKT